MPSVLRCTATSSGEPNTAESGGRGEGGGRREGEGGSHQVRKRGMGGTREGEGRVMHSTQIQLSRGVPK